MEFFWEEVKDYIVKLFSVEGGKGSGGGGREKQEQEQEQEEQE